MTDKPEMVSTPAAQFTTKPEAAAEQEAIEEDDEHATERYIASLEEIARHASNAQREMAVAIHHLTDSVNAIARHVGVKPSRSTEQPKPGIEPMTSED